MKKTKKAAEPEKLAPIQKMLDKDLKYYVEYDYESGKHGCTCGDNYCRCGTIEEAHVTKVSIPKIIEGLLDTTWHHQANKIERPKLSEIDQYCIDRILTIFKVWDKDNWNVNVCGGYYGEEIGSVTLDKDLATKVDAEIERLLAFKTTTEKVGALLVLEYRYLLPELNHRTYEIATLDRKQVIYQEGHYNRLDREVVEGYVDHKLPRGVVLLQQGDVSQGFQRYRLIDGYHRFSAAKEGQVRVIIAS